MKTGRPKAQFCKRGHDTFVCGRNPANLCRECSRFLQRQPSYLALVRKYHAKNYTDPIWREKYLERTRAWRRKNKHKVVAASAKWRDANREHVRRNLRNYKLRITYGIGIDTYEQMLQSQGGVCAICKGTPKGKINFCVDHDHATGAVRGLLCGTCNLAIGYLNDSQETFRNALTYLQRYAQLDLPKEVLNG